MGCKLPTFASVVHIILVSQHSRNLFLHTGSFSVPPLLATKIGFCVGKQQITRQTPAETFPSKLN